MEITEERASSWSRSCCIVASALTGYYSLFLLALFPETRFVEIFKMMGGMLPFPTRIFLHYRLDSVFGAILILILILGISKEFMVKDPVRKLALNFGQLALVMVISVAYDWAILLPVAKMDWMMRTH